MGELNNKSRKYIEDSFPEVIITEDQFNIYARGRFIINAQYQDITIEIAPKLKLIVPKNYPQRLPMVYELDGKIKAEHLLSDHGLCVATEFDLILELSTSKSIEDYFDKFLIPYFISYQSWIEKGKYIFGDRTHGLPGIYESLGEYFNINPKNREYIQKLLQWAAKMIPFFKIFSCKDRISLRRKFNNRIAILRGVGIHNLRRVYKNLISLKEYEKHYYLYKRFLENIH